MNNNGRQPVGSRRAWLALMLVVFAMVAAGCMGGGGSPPPANQLHIEDAAGWYGHYRTQNGGKAPPNEQAFVAFIERTLKERGITVNVIQDVLTSPRDGQKYVIAYKPNSNNPEKNVAVQEQTVYDGKKWIAFESKWSMEVDEAKLQELLSQK